jgi:hypothetical protein
MAALRGDGPDKHRWEEAEEEEEEVEAEEKIRLKQYVSLRSKGRYNNAWVQENVNKQFK